VKGVKKIGVRLGNWLTPEQSEPLWNTPDCQLLKGKRDRALLAVLLACVRRWHEAVSLEFSHVPQREDHWAIVDLKGKAGHTRTVPMPGWVKVFLDEWLQAANVTAGKRFRRVNKNGKAWGDGLKEKAVWHVVREYARKAGIERLAPHDLRRTCAPALPFCGWRTGADSVSSRACLHSNDRAVSGLQAAHSCRRQ